MDVIRQNLTIRYYIIRSFFKDPFLLSSILKIVKYILDKEESG